MMHGKYNWNGGHNIKAINASIYEVLTFATAGSMKFCGPSMETLSNSERGLNPNGPWFKFLLHLEEPTLRTSVSKAAIFFLLSLLPSDEYFAETKEESYKKEKDGEI